MTPTTKPKKSAGLGAGGRTKGQSRKPKTPKPIKTGAATGGRY